MHRLKNVVIFIQTIYKIILPIIDQWSMQTYFYLYDDKVLILKYSLFLSNTNTDIWSKERRMGPHVANMSPSR